MSDLMLMGLAQKIAETRTKELIEEYNNPDLTMEGKREILEEKMLLIFLEGYRIGEEREQRRKREDQGETPEDPGPCPEGDREGAGGS